MPIESLASNSIKSNSKDKWRKEIGKKKKRRGRLKRKKIWWRGKCSNNSKSWLIGSRRNFRRKVGQWRKRKRGMWGGIYLSPVVITQLHLEWFSNKSQNMRRFSQDKRIKSHIISLLHKTEHQLSCQFTKTREMKFMVNLPTPSIKQECRMTRNQAHTTHHQVCCKGHNFNPQPYNNTAIWEMSLLLVIPNTLHSHHWLLQTFGQLVLKMIIQKWSQCTSALSKR